MKEVHVAIPDSLLMEDRDLRDRTVKVGFVARALAIFRVERVYVFKDPVEDTDERESLFISELLQYIETPQYLRKRIYPLRPELKYAGLMPPLKIPSHKKEQKLVDGEYREGVVEQSKDAKTVFVGVDKNIRFIGNAGNGSRVTVRIKKEGDTFSAVQVKKKEVPGYWGYVVLREKNILQLCRSYELSIVTSRLGEKIQERWDSIKKACALSNNALIVFGAPKRGLLEMFPREEWKKVTEFIINTIPNQGVETVRTEEALLATLEAITLAANLQ
jgi:predicted SPOUT superfamily RNA methylase MTH1